MRRRATAMPGRQLPLRCLAGLVGTFLLVGSAAAQDAATIAQAQAALEAARSTRAVRALAAPELDAAEEALERALAARAAGRPRGEVEHLAYLADRRAAIARMHAKERQIARVLAELSPGPMIGQAIGPGSAAPPLSAGAPTDDPPTTTRPRVDW